MEVLWLAPPKRRSRSERLKDVERSDEDAA